MKNKNGHACRQAGFTLIELLIVLVVLAVLMIAAIGVLNPTALVNKGYDAQRKKDLKNIKVAFEDYFNDNGSYPQDVKTWNKQFNCNSRTVFAPYLTSWPCDPSGIPYIIIVDKVNEFRILTNLENKKDLEIPENWYTRTDIFVEGYTKDQFNYGVSSSNILWYEETKND